MKVKRKKKRRSDHKVMTKEASLLKFLRESRNLSMRNAGAIIGVSSSFVNHAENGRLDLNTTIILKFLKAYGYRLEEFESMKKGNIELPEHTLSECIEILKRLEPSKLKTVKTILESF